MPKVYNVKNGEFPEGAVYIGRTTEWGNPFRITDWTSRKDAIEQHRFWVFNQPEFVAHIKRELRGKDLVCHCAPQACHGDTLLEIANEA